MNTAVFCCHTVNGIVTAVGGPVPADTPGFLWPEPPAADDHEPSGPRSILLILRPASPRNMRAF